MASISASFAQASLITEDFCLPSVGTMASSSSAIAHSKQVQGRGFRSRQMNRSKDFLMFRPASFLHRFVGQSRRRKLRFCFGNIRAFAMDLAEEAQTIGRRNLLESLDVPPMSMPSFPRNNADDASLHNPLLRLHRMGCGWLGVIMEWDGVVVEDDSKLEREAWLALAQEEGRCPPPTFILKKAEGMKREHAISEVLCWSRDPKEMKRLGQRGEEIFQELQGGIYRQKPGSREFVLTLKKHNIPYALASTRPRRVIEKAIEAVGLEGEFNVVVTAEDVLRGKPDPEMYMYAAQLLGVIPERCIVIGNSNSSVEAAHDTFMKCIAVAGKHPMYELGAADLVITRFNNLSFVDLKNLADLDSPEFQPPEPQPEFEPEEDPLPQTRVALFDR